MNNTHYLEKEFYQIENHSDGKYIHIDGFIYHNECGEWRNVQAVGVMCHIDELKNTDLIDLFNTTTQYETVLTEEQVSNCVDGCLYFENPVLPLLLSEVTKDTPCGYYVNCKE